MAEFLSLRELESHIDDIRSSPPDEGRLELIVRRPQVDTRETLNDAELSTLEGLVGDSWLARCGTGEDEPDRETQITIMNSRAASLIAGDRQRWPLAGDQLYVDFDLSVANLPPGTRLAIGGAVVVVTAIPHTGCRKFSARFGTDAVRFVNSPAGKSLNLRGINARVETAGAVRVGDCVRKIAPRMES